MIEISNAPGVIGIATRIYLRIADAMEILGCQKSYASSRIVEVNERAKAEGKMVFPEGKANKYLFAEMYGIPIEAIDRIIEKNDRKEKKA